MKSWRLGLLAARVWRVLSADIGRCAVTVIAVFFAVAIGHGGMSVWFTLLPIGLLTWVVQTVEEKGRATGFSEATAMFINAGREHAEITIDATVSILNKKAGE